jgi:hypothetical protein
MSTYLQLVNMVLRNVGQQEVSSLTNAPIPASQVKGFLNDIYLEMLQLLHVNRLVKIGSISTTAGINSYSVASDTDLNGVLGDTVIETASAIVLDEVDDTYPIHRGLNASGRPSTFYRRENSLVFYPTPNAVYAIQYSYRKKPQPLSSDFDTPVFPSSWERVLVVGTQALLEKFLGENGVEASYLKYREGISFIKSEAARKPNHRMKGAYRGGSSI